MDAFILAAGRGERLRPVTDHVPKPLIEVGGQPLIVRHVERLAEAGFRRIIINVAWLGEKIMEHLGSGEAYGVRLFFSEEPAGALETAGGIVNALPLIESETFVLVNADVFTDFPFSRLQVRPGCDAELVMVPNPPHNPEGDFALRGDTLLMKSDGLKSLTYAGIGWFRRALFTALAPGRRSLKPILDDAVRARRVAGREYHGLWMDIGSPERLRKAREAALRQRQPDPERL